MSLMSRSVSHFCAGRQVSRRPATHGSDDRSGRSRTLPPPPPL